MEKNKGSQNVRKRRRFRPFHCWYVIFIVFFVGVVIVIILALLGPIIGNVYSVQQHEGDCAFFGHAEAFLDENANGSWDNGEQALSGIRIKIGNMKTGSARESRVTNVEGTGSLYFMIFRTNCENEFDVYVDVPTKYQLTTPTYSRIKPSESHRTFSFGFIEKSSK